VTRFVLAFAAIVLLLGAALQAMTWRSGSDARATALPLNRVLPADIPGWTSRAEKLGATEFLDQNAHKVLNFDDCFYRSYRRGSRMVSVYVAYWSPDRIAPSEVGMHTPDICWTQVGWACEASQTRSIGEPGVLIEAEWRKMRFPPNSVLDVAYWHLAGGKPYKARFIAGIRSGFAFWKQALRGRLRTKNEQYFIRLATNVPFEQLADDPGFQEIVGALAKLGLAAR